MKTTYDQLRDALSARASWMAEHADVVGWVQRNSMNDLFAISLSAQLDERGRLSEKQVACVRETIAERVKRASA